MAKRKPKERISRELKLARHWRKKANLPFSDFDYIVGTESEAWEQRPSNTRVTRCEAMLFNDMSPTDFDRARRLVCDYITTGFPLSFHEFHLALAFGYLITDLPYEEFYKTRWHENAAGRTYGSADNLPPVTK